MNTKTTARRQELGELIAAYLKPRDLRVDHSAPAGLTLTQGRLIQGLWDGKLDKELADDLHITRAGVRYHLRRLYRKFGCLNRCALSACAAFAVLHDDGGTMQKDTFHNSARRPTLKV
jgi:DNA-binding CsgD family transcriptional regulator